jgi:hypothetical protein
VINQIPVAEMVVVPALDSKPLAASEPDIYANLQDTERGDTVIVQFSFTATADPIKAEKELKQQPTVVFAGVLMGWGPVWLGPSSMRMTIWAMHPLGMLDWVSPVLDPIHGSGFDDYDLPSVAGKGQDLVPYTLSGYDPDKVKKDLWKNLIKPELVNLCSAYCYGQPNTQDSNAYFSNLLDYFKDEKGAKFDGSEVPLSYQFDDVRPAIMDIRRRLYSTTAGRRTLWDALIEIADVYKFSVICRSVDYSVAPVLKALGGDNLADFNLQHAWSYVARAEYNYLTRALTQAIGTLRGQGGATGFFDTVAKRQQRLFKQEKGAQLIAGTEFSMVPTFLDFVYDPCFQTKKTMGLGTTKLYASGYRLTPPSADEQKAAEQSTTLNKQYNTAPKSNLDDYANVVANDKIHSGPTAVFQGVVDYSVSPGNTVAFEPPALYPQGKELGNQFYFCLIWGVTQVLDSTSKRSGTYVIVTHVRTTSEQTAIELTKHPMYDKRWISASLLAIPGYTEAAKNA